MDDVRGQGGERKMEEGSEADERNQSIGRGWVWGVLGNERDGSWRDGAEKVRVGSKLHKVGRGYRLG